VAGVKHTFSVNIADDASAIAAGMVLPSHWNAEHTLSGVATQVDLDAVSAAVSVVSQALSVEIVDRISADNALSNAVSAANALISNLTSAHNVLSNQVSANSGVGGGGSVTSTEVSAGDAAVSLQAASALSQALSTLSVTDAALSVRIDTQSQSISVLSQQVSVLSQAHSALSQNVSVMSNTLSNEISVRAATSASLHALVSNLTSAHNVLSNTVSDAQSAGDVISLAVSNLTSAHNALSNVVSNIISAGGAGVSVTSNELSAALAVSARAFSASGSATTSVKGLQSAINRISNNLSNAMSAGSHVMSVISAIKSAVSGVSATSAGGGSATGLQAVVNALSNKISATAAGSQSVTSLEFVDLTSAHNALSNRVSANSGVGGGGSVTSAEYSVRSVGDVSTKGFQSVLNALSTRISHAQSAASQALSAASQAASANAISIGNVVSAQAASALSQALSVLSVTDAALSVRGDSVWSAVSVLRSVISARSTGDVSTHGMQSIVNALSSRIAAGGGSVTSTEVSAGDAAVSLQAASALSQALSTVSVAVAAVSAAVVAEVSNRTSADNAVSNAASANAISIRNAQSIGGHANVSILSPTSTQVLKYNSAAAQWVNSADATGAGGSVTSTEVSAGDASVAAQAASALSQALSVLSVTDAALSVRGDSVWSAVSVLRSVISARSTGDVSTHGMQSIINALSARVAAGGVDSTEVSNKISAAFASISVRSFSASGSATTSVKGLQSAINQISNSMSNAMSAGSHIKSVLSHTQSVVSHQGSVISHQGSVLSAASVDLASVKAVISNLNSAHNVLSNAVSALSSEQDKGMVSVAQSVSAATLTNISGLSVSVSTGGVYQLDGVLKINRLSADQPVRLGLTFSAMAGIRGWVALGNSVVVMFDGDSASGSILISSISAGGLSTMAVINAIVEPSVVGTIQLQIATSATTNVNTVARGSYIRVFKIN
jgi:hypothetical protein